MIGRGRRGAGTIATVALVLAGLATSLSPASADSSASAAGTSPGPVAAASADTVHQSRFWSWTGPRNWHAGYGAYGITVFGNDGEVLDLGFSSILCTPAPSVISSAQRYFKRLRQSIARGRPRIVRAGPIRRVRGLGPNYFRQSLNIATRKGGRVILGQAALDYQVPDPNYCYQRSLSLSAPAGNFRADLNRLLRIYGSLAYFGPGAPFLPDD